MEWTARNRMTIRIVLTATVMLALANAVQCAEPPTEVQHSVFIANRDTSIVTVIDNRTDRIVDKLDLGLVPTQIEVSSALPRLIATNWKWRSSISP